MKGKVQNFGPLLDKLTDIKFLWNTSPFDFTKLLDDPDHLADNLRAYIHGFSPEIRDIIDKFDLAAQITRLDKANRHPQRSSAVKGTPSGDHDVELRRRSLA